MTQHNYRIRAIVLAALMVLSVFAGTIALSGVALADDRDATDNVLGNQTDIFLGEDLTGFSVSNKTDAAATDNTTTAISTLIHTETGEQLEPDIPLDATLGRYSADGTTTGSEFLNLRRPIISNFDINNANGDDVAGGTLVPGTSPGTVDLTYNFHVAEDIAVSVTAEHRRHLSRHFGSGSATDCEHAGTAS